jgi:hypothetical protein
MQELAVDWPMWLGTPLQGGTFVLLLIFVVRTSPAWLTTWSSLRLAKSQRNTDRIKELEKQVKDCRAECDAQTRELQDQIQGLRQQRNTEQLVIMRAIVSMSGDPAVKQQLELLEAMEISLASSRRAAEGEANGD